MICQLFCALFGAFAIKSLATIVALLFSFWCLINAQSNPPQRFAIEPTDKSAIVGDSVVLPCRVVNKVGTLQWTRDGFGLGSDRYLDGFPRYSMIGTDEEGDYSLQISQVSLEDDAVFQCQVGAADGVRGIRSRSATFSVLVPPDPPIIVQARAQGELMRTTAGTTIELTCEAHAGKPPAELTWLDKDGSPVTKGVALTKYKLSDGKRWNAALKWSLAVTRDYDGKTLTCRSENSALKIPAKTSIKMAVKYAPEVQLRIVSTSSSGQSPFPPAITQIGDDVQFACNATGNPRQLLYKWFMNGEIVVGDHNTAMTLRGVSRAANGAAIVCEVSNSVGTTRATRTLSVAYGPSFRAAMETVYAAEPGQDQKMRCEVDGNPRPDITWLMVGSGVVIGQGVEIVVRNVSAAKAGAYVCRASVKGFDEIAADVRLHLKGPPRIRGPFEQFGVEGETVRLECLVESVPTPKRFLWQHNWQSIDTDRDDNYDIVEESSVSGDPYVMRSIVVIRRSKASDFGAYNCTVWNKYGLDSRAIYLLRDSLIAPMMVAVGIAVCGAVLLVVVAIAVALCVRRRSALDYGSDYKKSSQSQSSANLDLYYNTSIDSDSDIKVEVRTASSLSRQWTDDSGGAVDGGHELAKAVENIYGHTNRADSLLFGSTDSGHQWTANNGYVPYGHHSHGQYLASEAPSVPSDANLLWNRQQKRSSVSDGATAGTRVFPISEALLDFEFATAAQSQQSLFGDNHRRYISANGEPSPTRSGGQALATHV